MSLDTLEAIRTRRVTRFFLNRTISKKILWKVLEAARWAPTGSGRRVHRYVCVTDPVTIRQIRMMSPGIVGNQPAALIVICVDWNRAGYQATDDVRAKLIPYVDVGTAAQTMMLAAHALGLGAGPVTAFSPEAIDEFLNLPDGWRAEMVITLGYKDPTPPAAAWKLPRTRISVEDLVQWGPFPEENTHS